MSDIMSDEAKVVTKDVGELKLSDHENTMLARLCKEVDVPLFKSIRIYGTLDDPYYVAKDIQDLLGSKNLHFWGAKSNFKSGLHIVKIAVPTSQGVRLVVAFTEAGLIKAVAHNNSEISDRILTYITVVLKQLMREGTATIARARDEYKIQIDKQRCELEKAKRELEASDAAGSKVFDENRALKEVEANDIAHIKNLKLLNSKLLQEHDISNKTVVQYLIRNHARPVYIVLLKAPKKDVKGVYDYDIDDDIMIDSCEYVFTFKKAIKRKKVLTVETESTLSFEEQMEKNQRDNPIPTGRERKTERKTEKKPAAKQSRIVGKVYIHPEETIDVLFDMMDRQDVNLEHSDEKVGIHERKYVSPLANIKMDANDRYLKALANFNASEDYDIDDDSYGLADNEDNNRYYRDE